MESKLIVPQDIYNRIEADALAWSENQYGHDDVNKDYLEGALHEAMIAQAEYVRLKGQPGPVWVKASERLPGWKKRVKWRDGNNHSYATDGEISLFEMEKPNLEGWEWLDESPATFNPELFQIIRDAEVSKEEDLKAVKEVIGGAAVKIDREWVNNALVEFALAYHRIINKDIANDAAEYLNDKLNEAGVIYVLSEDESAAGREEAVEFTEWLLEYGYEPSFEKKWVDYSKKGDNRVSSAELYELFKQQKEK